MTSHFVQCGRLVGWPGCGRQGMEKGHRLRRSVRHPPASRSWSWGQRSEQAASQCGAYRFVCGGAGCCGRRRVVVASPSFAVRVIPLRGGRTALLHHRTSFQGPTPPFRDPQHVYGIPKSSVRMRSLHPSKIERIRTANLLAE